MDAPSTSFPPGFLPPPQLQTPVHPLILQHKSLGIMYVFKKHTEVCGSEIT